MNEAPCFLSIPFINRSFTESRDTRPSNLGISVEVEVTGLRYRKERSLNEPQFHRYISGPSSPSSSGQRSRR